MADSNTAILVIEDDPEFRRGLALWLTGAGYRPVEAADAEEGLEALDRESPEAVLLDLRLPGRDGFAVLAEMASQDDPPPVIVISGQDEKSGVIRAFRLGAADYLEKPLLDFDLLDHALTTVLDRVHLARRHALLVENLPLLVFALRPDLELEFVNTACRSMLGYGREEALASPDWLLSRVHADDRERIRSCLGGRLGAGLPVHGVECRLVHKNGATLHVLLTAMPAPPPAGPGLPWGVEGFAVDITDRVELERFVVQEEKLKTLGAISAEVAHEIRNPLFSIAGFAHRLKARQPDNPEVDIILSEARRLEDILDRIGNYLHPVDLRPRLCSLSAVIDTTLGFLAPELAAKKVRIETRLDPSLPELRLDPELLGQAATTLIRFAVRRLPEGGTARLTTATGQRFARLNLEFALPEPVREPELLFLPFEEGDERVGLPLAHRIVKNLGGSLTYEQTEAGLALFSARLPMPEAGSAQAGA